MGILSKIFGVQETAKEIVSATIATGDKLFFTDEEKADAKQKVMEYYPTLLKAYEPFKLSQRVLAFIFSILFSMAFLTGIGMTVFNIVNKYNALSNKQDMPPLLDLDPLYNLVTAFSLDWIMITIVGFYFLGGSIESFRRKDK